MFSEAETDFLHLRYRPDTHLLVARWRRPVSALELRQGYRTLLRAARVVQCPFWLLDIRGGNMLDEETLGWLLHKFLPRLPVRLGGPACLAYLLSPNHRRLINPPAPQQPTGLATQTCVAHFTDEGAVLEWLTQCQRRLQAKG